jgi:chromosomal replication initiation ATPase DnaA
MTRRLDLERQLHIDFPRIDPLVRPLIETGPYEGVVHALSRWRAWPEQQMAVFGERGSGRSRLVREWACEAGAALTTGSDLGAADVQEISNLTFAALAIDDADLCAQPTALLTTLNLCRARGASVLMSGVGPPSTWFAAPGDLVSRLRATPASEIGPPDEDSLLLRLREACAVRYLSVPEASLSYLVERMDRSWEAVGQLADRIVTTPGRGFTLHSARQVLLAMGREAPSDAPEAPDGIKM